MQYVKTENATYYRDRWPFILYNIAKRLETNALHNQRCHRTTKIKRKNNEPLFMIFVWTGGQTADIPFPGKPRRFFDWMSWFDEFYQIFVQNMVDGIQLFLQQYPQYKSNIRLIDTAYVTTAHYNLHYTPDGLHYWFNNSHNVVSDMSTQILLNHFCPSNQNDTS